MQAENEGKNLAHNLPGKATVLVVVGGGLVACLIYARCACVWIPSSPGAMNNPKRFGTTIIYELFLLLFSRWTVRDVSFPQIRGMSMFFPFPRLKVRTAGYRGHSRIARTVR